jgi:hypothetical protein
MNTSPQSTLGQFRTRLLAFGLGILLSTPTVSALAVVTCAHITGPVYENHPLVLHSFWGNPTFTGIVASNRDSNPVAESYTISWGDGTVSTGRSSAIGSLHLASGGHTYSAAMSGVSISVQFDTGESCSSNAFDVLALPPDVLSNPWFGLTAATVAVPVHDETAAFFDANPYPIASDFTASINWGDGTVTAGVIEASIGALLVFPPPGGHAYSGQGSFTVSATVTQNAPGTATSTATGTVVVTAQPPPPPPPPPPGPPPSPPGPLPVPVPAVTFQGLWWVPGGAESGSGISIAHQGGEVFATWFTYDTNGKPWWLSMLGIQATPGTFSGPIYVDRGPAFNNYNAAAVPSAVGGGTLTFTDANNGSFASNVNGIPQTKAITRFDLGTGPQPTCTYSNPSPDPSKATNYQDDWWVANGAEPGWGLNLVHQRDSIFATWYTYDVDGTPLWLSALAQRQGMSSVYGGTLYRSSGPRFDAYDATKVVINPVGTATLTFVNGNAATFAYTTTGADGVPAVVQTKQITRFLFGGSGAGTICQ